jgi:hypothetical protein
MGADSRCQICKNRLVWAAMAGTLVWFADLPTVTGYNPLLEVFRDPGIWRTPAHDRLVLLLRGWLLRCSATLSFLRFRRLVIERAK